MAVADTVVLVRYREMGGDLHTVNTLHKAEENPSVEFC